MIVVNLFGGPGVGKSTVAAMLFAHYKRRGIRVEMGREVAKELLYQGRDLRRNQFLLTAMQYQILADLDAAGTDLVISDTALRLNLVYARHLPFYAELCALVNALRGQFREVDVMLHRAVEFQTHGRVEASVEDAKKIDAAITGPFDVEVDTPNPAAVIAALDPILLPLTVGRKGESNWPLLTISSSRKCSASAGKRRGCS